MQISLWQLSHKSRQPTLHKTHLHLISRVQLIQNAELIFKPVALTTLSLNTGHGKYLPGSGCSWHHPLVGTSPSDSPVLCLPPSIQGRGRQDGWAQMGCKQCEYTTLNTQLSQGYVKAHTQDGLPRTLCFCVFSHCKTLRRAWVDSLTHQLQLQVQERDFPFLSLECFVLEQTEGVGHLGIRPNGFQHRIRVSKSNRAVAEMLLFFPISVSLFWCCQNDRVSLARECPGCHRYRTPGAHVASQGLLQHMLLPGNSQGARTKPQNTKKQ